MFVSVNFLCVEEVGCGCGLEGGERGTGGFPSGAQELSEISKRKGYSENSTASRNVPHICLCRVLVT